jgi:hypothetical protein
MPDRSGFSNRRKHGSEGFPQSDQIGLHLCYLRFLLLILWGILDILNRGIIKPGISARARARYIDIA